MFHHVYFSGSLYEIHVNRVRHLHNTRTLEKVLNTSSGILQIRLLFSSMVGFTFVVYKFSCASCNAYVDRETSRHFSTQVQKHLLSGRLFLDICRVQSFVKHAAHWIALRSWTLQLLSIELSLRNPRHKMGENQAQLAGETHKPDSLPVPWCH